MNRKGLGRGLDALLAGDYQSTSGESVTELALADIVPNRFQPRREFDEAALEELRESDDPYLRRFLHRLPGEDDGPAHTPPAPEVRAALDRWLAQ